LRGNELAEGELFVHDEEAPDHDKESAEDDLEGKGANMLTKEHAEVGAPRGEVAGHQLKRPLSTFN